MLARLPISVIETKWFQETNTSVKGLFDLLADIHCHNPSAYHYEMFGSKRGFEDVFHRVARGPLTKEIYIASHGSSDGLQTPEAGGLNDDFLSRKFIRSTVEKFLDDGNKRIDGIFFGCCEFGTELAAGEILDLGSHRRNSLRWICGYQKSVDWVESSALDMLFWNKYIEFRYAYSSSPREAIEKVSHYLNAMAGGLCSELGFAVYVRKVSRDGGVVNLIQSSNHQ